MNGAPKDVAFFDYNFVILAYLCSVTLILLSEQLNTLASNHWQYLATQDYFDRRGVFASAMFAAPLLIAGFWLLVR